MDLKSLSTAELITIVISALSLIVSAIALVRDFCTRKKVQELTNLEIEKLKAEKEKKKKANVYGYVHDDHFVIENNGEAPASNIRYEGWQDWSIDAKEKVVKYLSSNHQKEIKLWACADSPSEVTFRILWDDESGKDHEWSETLSIDD